MGILDSFADAVASTKPKGPMFGSEPQPQGPIGQQPTGQLPAFGQQPAAAPVVVNVGANPYGSLAAPHNDPLAAQREAEQKWATTPVEGYQGPTWEMQPGEIPPGSPAYMDSQISAREDGREAQRQAFKASLSPEVSQAFASFMDGIAEQEAMKQISAPGAARMFGA